MLFRAKEPPTLMAIKVCPGQGAPAQGNEGKDRVGANQGGQSAGLRETGLRAESGLGTMGT